MPAGSLLTTHSATWRRPRGEGIQDSWCSTPFEDTWSDCGVHEKSAVELIGSKDPENPTASFKDYERLYGGHHPFNTKLDPGAVFNYLVEKGLFRMGAELACPHCRLSSWTALDVLKQRLVCEMCGQSSMERAELINGAWHYRRSGVLGAERNAQGAIPVVLTLQQFKVNLNMFRDGMYSPSLDLVLSRGRICRNVKWILSG